MMLGRASRLVRRPLVRDASKVASTFDDMIPMTIADRIEQQAVTAGTFENLSGSGKPLSQDPNHTQVHIGALPKNMDARAEAEMRRAVHSGLLKDLAGEGKPISDEHAALKAAGSSGGPQAAQQRIQQHVLKSKS